MSIQHLVNQYQPRTKEVMLGDNVKVIFVESSYQKTMDKIKELLSLLKGALTIRPLPSGVKSAVPFDFNVDFAAIAANLKSDEMDALELFIKSNCKMALLHEGEWLSVDVAKKDQFEYVFNTYPDQAFKFLVEGAKFHFLKYSANILGLLESQMLKNADQEVNKQLLSSLKDGSKV